MPTTQTDAAMLTPTTVTYGDIKNGDIVLIEGHRFVVSELERSWSSRDSRWQHDRIEFTGHCADATDPIRHTRYDGGRYAGFAFRPAVIYPRT